MFVQARHEGKLRERMADDYGRLLDVKTMSSSACNHAHPVSAKVAAIMRDSPPRIAVWPGTSPEIGFFTATVRPTRAFHEPLDIGSDDFSILAGKLCNLQSLRAQP